MAIKPAAKPTSAESNKAGDGKPADSRGEARTDSRGDGRTETKTEAKARHQALEFAIEQIEKQYGKGSIMRLGQHLYPEIQCISTGSISLDLAIGGGIPRGRIIEIYGPESSGKTTLTLHIVANAQKTGGICAFIDAEHALDPKYATKLGVDFENLLVSQPDTGEQALEIADLLVRSNAVDVIVIDSVAALVPKAEIEGDMGDSHVGLHARLMSQALRKLTGIVSKSRTMIIFINQIREKIGVMFGSPETTTGGRALKFYASVRLDIRRIGRINEKEDVVGSRTKVTVVKNKIAPPFKVVEFDIMFDEGISYEGDILDLAVEHKIADKAGSWFCFGDIRLGQGREKSKLFLKENPDVSAKLRELLLDRLDVRRQPKAKAPNVLPERSTADMVESIAQEP